MVEKQISECNQNIVSNYERQLKLEFDLRAKREALIKQMSESKEDEMMGESGLSTGKKNQKKTGGDGWGFMAGMRPGFLNR